MKQKMVILNAKEYREKLSESLAYSLSDQHEKALKLLLELKEKRWVNFELFERIAQEYLALGQCNQAYMIIKQIKPINDKQQGQLLELEQQTKLQMEYGNQNQFQQEPQLNEQINYDEEIFKETAELCQQKEKLNQDTQDLQVLHNSGYYQSLKIRLQRYYGLDFTGISSLSNDLREDRIFGIYEFENYKQTLNLIEMCQENDQTLMLKAFCYQQVKQYKLALNTLKRFYEITYSNDLTFDVCLLRYLLGSSFSEIFQNGQTEFQFKLNYVKCKNLIDLDRNLKKYYNMLLR